MNLLQKIFRVLAIPTYRSAFLRHRVAASTEHDHILRGLKIDTIVDIGANRGQFALCARRLFPEAEIYSFEPLSRPAGVFRAVFQHDPHVRLFQVAVAPARGCASMHVSRWDASSSILPIAAAQSANFPFTQETARESVATTPLADCLSADHLSANSLLKMDVQGFELQALRGSEALLDRFRFVYVEASFVELYVGQALATEVIAYLLSKNFRLLCVANLAKGRSRRPIQADFLFARIP